MTGFVQMGHVTFQITHIYKPNRVRNNLAIQIKIGYLRPTFNRPNKFHGNIFGSIIIWLTIFNFLLKL